MLALNVRRQYTKCHVLIVRARYSEYAQRHRGRRQPHERGSMNSPAPRALALRTTGVTYPGTPEHISAVRTVLRPILRGCPMADDVILCASELAANAAIHSAHACPAAPSPSAPRSAQATSPGSRSRTTAAPGLQQSGTRASTTGSTSSASWPASAASTVTRTAAPSGPASTGPSDGRQVHRQRGPMDSLRRWPAVAGTPSPTGAISGRVGQAGWSQRAHGVQARTAASLLLPQPDPGPARSRFG